MVAGILAGCAPEATKMEPPAAELAPVAAEEAAGTATGTLVGLDGKPVGRVEVELYDTDDFGLVAETAIFDLAAPYARLQVGGSLAPRGDDPCFDEGLRSSGGMLEPDSSGVAVASLPAEIEGHELYELVLHLDHTNLDAGDGFGVGPEGSACLQPVVARAELTWTERPAR